MANLSLQSDEVIELVKKTINVHKANFIKIEDKHESKSLKELFIKEE